MWNNSLTDEFNQDNKIRPYTVGIKRHEETISTILLYQENSYPESSSIEESIDYDYLKNMSKEVNEITVEGVDSELSYGSVVEEPGSIAVVKLDGSNNYYGVFNNFSLISVRENTSQIKSVNVNFGSDWNAFFFGESPRVYTFSGYFIDSKNYPFYQEFFVAYEKYLSGRRTIENNMKTKFVYDGKIIDGYILGITVESSSQSPLLKQFEFSVLVRGVTWVRTNIIDSNYQVIVDEFGGLRQTIKKESVLNGMTNINRQKDLGFISVNRANQFYGE